MIMIMIQIDIVSYKMIQYEIKLHNFIIVSYNKFNIVQTILYHMIIMISYHIHVIQYRNVDH